MTYFWTCFRITLMQRLRNVKSWLILLVVPLLLIAIQWAIPPQQVSAPVQVGVVLPEEGGEEFWELLQRRSGTVLTFFQTDEETLNRNIATGKWDSGLILSEDFADKIETADTNRLFQIRVGEGSAVYPLVRETVSACVAALVRVPIAEEYLASGNIAPDADPDEIRARLEQSLSDEDRVQITMYTPDGESLHPFQLADQGTTQFLRWILSMSLMVWLLLSCCDLGRWSGAGAAKRLLPMLTPTAAMLPRQAVDSLLGILSGCAGIAVIGDGFPGLLAVIGYVLFWSSLSLLMAHFSRLWQSLPIMPAFAVVTSLLFSGVLVDLSPFIPAVSNVITYIPGRLYLQICQGSIRMVLPLLAAAAASIFLSVLTDKIKKR